MAEFKISRFRYTWKGDWNTSTAYIKDDVVKYGGSSWVCIRAHTSSAFQTDQDYLANESDTEFSPAWTKMTDGRNFRGSWNQSTLYNPGDILRNGGILYLCVTSHTSATAPTHVFSDDLEFWTVLSSTINFRNAWSAETRYYPGDVVVYGGNVYICFTENLSGSIADGLELNIDDWIVYYENIEFKGPYQNTTRYKENDLVLLNGSLQKCIVGHTSTEQFDSSKWILELDGFEFDLDWSSTVGYTLGSVVRYGGYLYLALKYNVNQLPSESFYDPQYWKVISKGINFRGNWSATINYITGDVVRRGGNLYVAISDQIDDGSSLNYLDASNWELLTEGINQRGSWYADIVYEPGDIIYFQGNIYKCIFPHSSDIQNFPENGSGFFYWDLILVGADDVGMSQRGDLLSYDLTGEEFGDQSTFAPSGVKIGTEGQILSIDENDSLFYKDFGSVARSYYVATNGVDDITNPLRGKTLSLPWRTVRFACEQADDGFSGFTTVNVAVGKYEEILPIIIPARTVVLGSELRSTTISANSPITNLSLDSTYTIAVLNRISGIIEDVIAGVEVTPTVGNTEEQVILTETVETQVSFDPPQFVADQEIFQTVTVTRPIITDPDSSSDVQDLIQDIIDYINSFVNSLGAAPILTGTNTGVTDSGYTNAVLVLEANKEFLAAEAVAFMQTTFPSYNFDSDLCKRDVRRYIDAWKYDIIYTGNYKSFYAARYYTNAVLGSASEDMFYLRDATGLRDCTITGLVGSLNPPNVFDLYRRPTGGSFCSLDPGWGPADDRTWITTRSPYIQGVTTIGTGCVGQKIDGSLHNGGNKSMVSNDFTQVLSDGVGAWVSNNGRAELVSVFAYYCQVGYLSENGGIIRGANGNCSYGRFGAIADGVDLTEIPRTATVNNRNNVAQVASAFAGEVNDEILLLEWAHAGQNYTQATASFLGSGIGVDVVFEDFRDDAVFQARIIDASDSTPNVGGGGYTLVGNNAQVSTPQSIDATGITIAANDSGSEAEYVGIRIIITSGVGTGQYGIITAYDTNTKVVSVKRESDGQPGWDHVIPGTPVQNFLTSTTYRIEPLPIFSSPGFETTSVNLVLANTWINGAYGETSATYTAIAGSVGTGVVVEDDGLTAITATWNVTKTGRNYTVILNNPGAGYQLGQTVTILGTALGGISPLNDITIEITGTTDDSTNQITAFTYEGTAVSGYFILTADTGSAAVRSQDGETWTSFNLPSSGNWKCIAAGDNKFVAIRYGSNVAASSSNGTTWVSRSMPASRNWNAVIYGGDKFVAIAGDQNSGAYSTNGTTWTSMSMPVFGDSTVNEWVDIAYGKERFVAIANSNNISASSSDGITWEGHIMDVIADSSSKDWVSIAYGNNRFVAITSTGDIAYSFDGAFWYAGTMPTQDGSTAQYWRKIRYAQGIFFAVGDTGARDIGGDTTTGPTTFAATSEDGILWTNRTLSASQEWRDAVFGNPYIDNRDSTIGKNTPMWITVAYNSLVGNKIRTGSTAKGRVITTSGVVSGINLWDPGSGYFESPTLELIDPNNTSDAVFDCRLADGVLTNPSWINRGLGYRTSTTTVTISGDGFADIIPASRNVTLSNLNVYPGPGAQLTFSGLSDIYTVVTVTELGNINGGLSALFRISPDLQTRDNLEHGTTVSIRERYSQVRISGHDFLDIGTGNFLETNYPELYQTGIYVPAPENEVVEEEGGRVFYTSTDQSGNFRAGELFAVEQATGIVTISADFFDLEGLSELALGGVRLGGSGAVIREFSTDPLFTEDSNNIIPTQRAIRAYLQNRLTVGGSEIATSSFIAGTVRVGPTFISNTAGLKIIVPKRAVFEGAGCGISGSILAQTMFFRSFNLDS